MTQCQPPPRRAPERATSARDTGTRIPIEAGIDGPLGPAMRLAAALGGARRREGALARAAARARDRDARAAVGRIAAARARQLRDGSGHAGLARARQTLLAARGLGLAAVAAEHTNIVP